MPGPTAPMSKVQTSCRRLTRLPDAQEPSDAGTTTGSPEQQRRWSSSKGMQQTKGMLQVRQHKSWHMIKSSCCTTSQTVTIQNRMLAQGTAANGQLHMAVHMWPSEPGDAAGPCPRRWPSGLTMPCMHSCAKSQDRVCLVHAWCARASAPATCILRQCTCARYHAWQN